MLIRLALTSLLLCLSAPSAASNWLRAESDNFVIHAKLGEDQMREVVKRMEDFRRLLQSQLPQQTKPGTKLQFYLDREDNRISQVFGIRNIGTARLSPEMSGAFVLYQPFDDPRFRYYALFYSYSIFHLDQSFFRTNPPWIRTGVPIFFATTFVSDEGHFIIGAPDVRRPLRGAVTQEGIASILATDLAPRAASKWKKFYRLSRETVYPLLTRPTYDGVLESYLTDYAAGRSMDEAAAALGDLQELAKGIEKRRRKKYSVFRQVTLQPRTPANVAMRKMTDAEIALVDVRFERLLDKKRVRTSRKLEKLTTRFPGSADVWYEYAASEFARSQGALSGGDVLFRGFGFAYGEIVVTAGAYPDANAWRAVNRALDLQQDHYHAIRLKAEILMARILNAGDIDDTAGFEQVRAMLAPLAASPEQNPLAANLLYQSYVEQGITPPHDAFDQLDRAFIANPGVEEFRYAYAVALAGRGQASSARILLASMLNNPKYRDAALRALDQTN